MLVWYLLLLLPCISATTSYSQCFEQHTKKAINNYLPLAEYKLVSLTTCMQNCIFASGNGEGGETICKSVTYNRQTHICKIFDHNGYKVPAILHPALGIDLFTRKMETDSCRGPPRRLTDNKDGNPNFIQLESSQSSKPHVNDITNFRTHDTMDNKQEDFFSNTFGDYRTKIPKKPRVFAAQPIHEVDGDIKVEQMESMRKHSDNLISCKNGYYVVLGTEIQKGDETEGLVQFLEGVEQGDCARLCSQNIGFEGKPFNCKSLNFYPASKKCELYSIQVEPNGPGKFLTNPNTIYSEKFCMPPTKKVCQSDEVFILHVQKTIMGRKLGEKMAEGITPCLAECLAKGQCKSAVYDDNKKRCTLYSINLASERDALRDTLPGAVAIENPCADGTARMHASKTFRPEESSTETDEWSSCNFKIDGKLYKVRNAGDQLEVRDC